MSSNHLHAPNEFSLTQWKACPACQLNAQVHRSFMEIAVPLYSRCMADTDAAAAKSKWYWQKLIVRDEHRAIDLVKAAGHLAEAFAYQYLVQRRATRKPV